MTSTEDPSALLPLTPAVLHILLTLSTGEKHGYAIMMEVAAQTDGAVRMGPGTLYGSVKRMIATGLIEPVKERPANKNENENEDERRRYYRLTDFGQRVLEAEIRRLESIVQLPVARKLLGVERSSG